MSTELDQTKSPHQPAARGGNTGSRGPFGPLLRRLREAVQRVYGDRLITLAVYGSVGRGTATAESDVDCLIVATDLPRGRLNRRAEFRQVEGQLQADLNQMEQAGLHTHLSPIFKTPEEVLMGSPLFLDMVFDAILLYDKEDFFKNFLADFKARLDRLGAKRIFVGDQWVLGFEAGLQVWRCD